MRSEMRELYEQVKQVENINRSALRRETNEEFSMAYERSERDIRHRCCIASILLSLKEARAMIPEFDGTSRKLHEFLNASTYAINNIRPSPTVDSYSYITLYNLKIHCAYNNSTLHFKFFDDFHHMLNIFVDYYKIISWVQSLIITK